MISRRVFLSNCSLTALAAAPAGPAIVADWASLPTSLDEIAFSDFQKCLNAAFIVEQPRASSLVMELVEASPLGEGCSGGTLAADCRNEKFSLIFAGPLARPVTQDTYIFRHRRLGRFGIFIVPTSGASKARRYYQAIFNRAPVRHVGALVS